MVSGTGTLVADALHPGGCMLTLVVAHSIDA